MKPIIGWIGTGKMGKPMVANLLKNDYKVYLYARQQNSLVELMEKGAGVTASPKELSALADILFLMVPDDRAIDTIFTSDDGILNGKLGEKIMVNMSTVSPDINRKMAALCQEKGASFLDIPVSGSVKQATDASLVLMAGGDQSVFEKIKPVLDCLGSKSLYIGSNGMGSTMKLAINMLLSMQAQSLAEVINFAESHGINASTVMETINNGPLANAFMKIKGEQIVHQNFNAAFSLSQMVKDLELAKKEGWNAPLGNTAFQTYQNAVEEFGGEDVIAIQKFLKQ